MTPDTSDATLASVGETPPDWNALDKQIHCPLCDYNLRGLTEARCPECGYQFQWRDLLDPDRTRHPYLFEDHPRRNVRSFFRTYLAAFFPRRFWSSLKPTHAPRPRRLFLYWIFSGGVLMLGCVVAFCVLLVKADQSLREMRNEFVRQTVAFFPPQATNQSAYISQVQARANSMYPSLLNWDGAKVVMADLLDVRHGRGSVVPSLVVCVGWPQLTFITLMIFQISMRRAKIRTVHVVRCIVYGGNCGLWIGLILLAILSTQRIRNPYDLSLQIAAISAGLALVNLYHLGTAYRRYLHFDRPWATIAASQIIVGLVFCTIALNIDRIVP